MRKVIAAIFGLAIIVAVVMVVRWQHSEEARKRRSYLVNKLNDGEERSDSRRRWSLDGDGLVLESSDCNSIMLHEYTDTRWIVDGLDESDTKWIRCLKIDRKLEAPWR